MQRWASAACNSLQASSRRTVDSFLLQRSRQGSGRMETSETAQGAWLASTPTVAQASPRITSHATGAGVEVNLTSSSSHVAALLALAPTRWPRRMKSPRKDQVANSTLPTPLPVHGNSFPRRQYSRRAAAATIGHMPLHRPRSSHSCDKQKHTISYYLRAHD